MTNTVAKVLNGGREVMRLFIYWFALLFWWGRGLDLCSCSTGKVEQEIAMVVAVLGEGLGNVSSRLGSGYPPIRNVYFLLTLQDSRWHKGGRAH